MTSLYALLGGALGLLRGLWERLTLWRLKKNADATQASITDAALRRLGIEREINRDAQDRDAIRRRARRWLRKPRD